MTFLSDELETIRLAKLLRNLSDADLSRLETTAKHLNRIAVSYEQKRRIACKVPPTREPMWIEEMMDVQSATARERAIA